MLLRWKLKRFIFCKDCFSNNCKIVTSSVTLCDQSSNCIRVDMTLLTCSDNKISISSADNVGIKIRLKLYTNKVSAKKVSNYQAFYKTTDTNVHITVLNSTSIRLFNSVLSTLQRDNNNDRTSRSSHSCFVSERSRVQISLQGRAILT
jgi:hypothetical protein